MLSREPYAPMRLRDLAVADRPQERLEQAGPGALADGELLAMLLRSGSRTCDVLDLSRRLLAEGGSLAGLLTWSVTDFQRMPGIGRVKALQLITVMELARRVLRAEGGAGASPFAGPDSVVRHFAPAVAGLQVEKFWVLCLNRKNRLLREVEVTSGTATSSLVHPREVFREAIRLSATAVIAVHNHPSGDPAPSKADISVTRQLREAAEVVGIDLLDHVILGRAGADPHGAGFYSFSEGGML